MAYQVRRIDPRDLQSRKAIGVNIPFSGNAVFNQTYQTKDAIKANLVNFLLTEQGERIFNPEFGASLRTLLFENITEDRMPQIKDYVRSKIKIYFPKIKIEDIQILPLPDENTLQFLIKYSIPETGIQDQEINIQFEQ